MGFSPLSDTSGVAEFNASRRARIAPPVLCAERVRQAVADGCSSREDLADYFDIAPSNFTLRRLVHELADAGVLVVVPDEAGYEPDLIRLAGRKTRRRAA